MISKGYTLLEVMVALVLFAILAAITASSMQHVFDLRLRLEEHSNRLNGIQNALAVLSRDIAHIVERPVRGNEMQLFPSFLGRSYYLEFTRGGILNPDATEQRSTLKRQALICNKDQLIRRTWLSLDVPERKLYRDKVLLSDLTECFFAYLDSNHQILEAWHGSSLHQKDETEPLPLAIQVNITLKHWGNASLLFPIPKALYGN